MLERLADLFPRYIRIYHSRYRRDELFKATHGSRKCAYLADDDHGPLALQEILLAGCPTVDVRTGASFVRDGVTGYVVERLPPGREFVATVADRIRLAEYLNAIQLAWVLDRGQVRRQAAADFSSDSIVNGLVTSLEYLRVSVPEAGL